MCRGGAGILAACRKAPGSVAHVLAHLDETPSWARGPWPVARTGLHPSPHPMPAPHARAPCLGPPQKCVGSLAEVTVL